MDMIIDVLSKEIKELKDLRQREERRDNKAIQDTLDHRFKTLTTQIHSLMIALQYAKKNMQFQLSKQLLSDLENLLTEHKSAIRSGYVEKEAIDQTESDYKNVQKNIKKEWSNQYSILANSTIYTLQVISSIDSDHVYKCLDEIAKGKIWTTNIETFKTMEKSLSEAKILIDGLRLDQQIIMFLQKMNKGKATVRDLDQNVLCWLEERSLANKIKLSFTGGE